MTTTTEQQHRTEAQLTNAVRLLGEQLAEVEKYLTALEATENPISFDLPDHGDILQALHQAGYWKDFRKPFTTLPGESFWFLPDLWVVALDITDIYGGGDLSVLGPGHEWIERIEEVRFFDRTQVTHLCSFGGTYWLLHIEDQAVFKPGVPEQVKDDIDVAIQGPSSRTPDDYFNQDEIDALLEEHQKNNSARVHHIGPPGIDISQMDGEADCDRYNTMMDELRQAYRENPVL